MVKYIQVYFPEELIKTILKFNANQNLSASTLTKNSDSNLITRNSKVSWIKDQQICRSVFNEVTKEFAKLDSHIHSIFQWVNKKIIFFNIFK